LNETKLPFIIALNKIDLPKADPETVENQLWGLGIDLDSRGGSVPIIHISAVENLNTNLLLELIIYEANRFKLRGSPKTSAECVAMECKFNEGQERKFCSLIIRDGTLKKGDYVVAGNSHGKVLSMFDDRGLEVTVAGPGSAVEISGLKTLPEAGEKVFGVANEKEAEIIVECRNFLRQSEEAVNTIDN